ncbi:hypothetical protein N9368_03015 [Alphaproteobacteria bacterium]|nr:hypothetical protein [Alphaproteobacteria bacterium]
MFNRLFVNLIIAILTLIASYIIVMSLLGITVVFPLSIVDDGGISRLRLESVRLATLGTFAFYGVMHLLWGSKEVFPVHFLKTFLFFLSILGAIMAISDPAEVAPVGWFLIVFFFGVALSLQITTSPKYKRYFGRK